MKFIEILFSDGQYPFHGQDNEVNSNIYLFALFILYFHYIYNRKYDMGP